MESISSAQVKAILAELVAIEARIAELTKVLEKML